jgi:hypothetical protein
MKYVHWLFGISLLLVLIGSIGSAFSANMSICTPTYDGMVKKLTEYGEVPVVTWAETWRKGKEDEYVLFKTIFAHPDGSTWTMTMGTVSGGTCTMRDGEGVHVDGE